jgi:beta-lactam-binding protein with PASTA domain
VYWFGGSRSPRARITADAGHKQVDEAPAVPATESSAPEATSDSRRDVPLLVGTSLVEARAQLERMGLVVGDVREMTGGGTDGTITAQRPAAGERVGLGTTIDLVVAAAAVAKPESIRPPSKSKSEPRAVPDLEVPALTGLSIEVARDRLVRRGLSVGRISVKPASRSETALVLVQDPAAGTRQPPGTAISLVIGGAP